MSPVIACDLTAIPVEERATHMARASRLLFSACVERQELPNGFAWRYEVDEYDEVRQYIAKERRCCPFFTFELEVVAERRALWLRITGDAEIKAFLQLELDHYASLAAASVPSAPLADADAALIVCDLTALASGEEEALTELSKQLLFIICEERRELPDGYAWRYSAEHFDDVCHFIDGDSRCCAFFTHTLEVPRSMVRFGFGLLVRPTPRRQWKRNLNVCNPRSTDTRPRPNAR